MNSTITSKFHSQFLRYRGSVNIGPGDIAVDITTARALRAGKSTNPLR